MPAGALPPSAPPASFVCTAQCPNGCGGCPWCALWCSSVRAPDSLHLSPASAAVGKQVQKALEPWALDV